MSVRERVELTEAAPKWVPPAPADVPDRRFEAVVFDWDGTAVPDRHANASAVRQRVEALCEAGADVIVVSGTHVGNIDGQLRARPRGPGRLRLCLNRGSEVFAVGPEGPVIEWRRTAAGAEDAALDAAADATVARLAERGLEARIVSQRLNRRKIDLIPLPEWEDPPKARIDELLRAVEARLAEHGISGLDEVVSIARSCALDAGLPDPRVTSDVKHVEIGLTDKSDSVRWVLDDLWERGIGPGLVLVAGDEFGPLGGVTGSDALMLAPSARVVAVSVGVEPEGVPAGVISLGGGPRRFLSLLEDQLALRRGRRVPAVDEDPAWTLTVPGYDPDFQRVQESLLTLADGRFGTRGALEEDGKGSDPLVLAQGVYSSDGDPHLLPCPLWTDLRAEVPSPDVPERRVLDLRTGTLYRERTSDGVPLLRTFRFSSLARPGTMCMRAEVARSRRPSGPPLRAPDGAETGRSEDGAVWARVGSLHGGVVAAAKDRVRHSRGLRVVERLAGFVAGTDAPPPGSEAIEMLRAQEAEGFDRLLAEHRAAWAARWGDALVCIEGDPDTELAVRFALFHLMASATDEGEAAVGARGLTGGAYSGHVFWDAEVFVLPFLAATHPEAARAMLSYRVARLDAAREEAHGLGYEGARFPWESARDGRDVTPSAFRDDGGGLVPIRTGQHEEHIVADVAWASRLYESWTGDRAFLAGPGRPLLTDTARYWASRVRWDAAGAAHLYGVIGPDEYHGPVDDNAFTNVMARWNLRCAAGRVERDGVGATPDEVERWRATADALVDGYGADDGLYEQFAGFRRLEPLVIEEFADPPIAADVLLGAQRVAAAQVVKQPDVLMLHHLVPDEVVPGSLGPNLDFYGPRTAHGSSLSPAIHAALLARAGRPDDALRFLRIASRLDLDDLTGTTSAGLHLATFGGVWQALAFGFAGMRVDDGVLRLDPVLPGAWSGLVMRVRVGAARVETRITHDDVRVLTDGPVRLKLPGRPAATVSREARFERGEGEWREKRP